MAIYAAAKAITQLILARYGDESSSVKMRLKLLVIGGILLTLVPLVYLFISNVIMLFIAQALWGIGEALVAPAWFSLFNQSLPEARESRAWQWRETVGLILTGLAAIAGGWLANVGNYGLLFIGMAFLIGLASWFSIRLYRSEEEGRHLSIRSSTD